ncbi:MAG: hypothetical protein KA479_12230 [Saprospiraceae bacterium]|nr:hypothetical protein [Saprospiraceae bacterium]
MTFKFIIYVLSLFLPWPVRRFILNGVFGYKIHPKARIGFSIIMPDHLEMNEGARIGHLNICKGLNNLWMGEQSTISTLNWITGFSIRGVRFFRHKEKRDPSLRLGHHSAITNRHYIDCSDEIRIGDFTTVAGIGSQFLTHSINLMESIQDCSPITIGSYCFIGTNSVLLPGSALGNYCVLSASSLLNKKMVDEYILVGGVPAKPIQNLPRDMKYFSRDRGFVN